MRVLGVLLILLLQAYPPGEDVFPVGGSGSVAPPAPAVTCPCWDAADWGDPLIWGTNCPPNNLAPEVGAVCGLEFALVSCSAGGAFALLVAEWSAGAGTCSLVDKDFAPVTSGAGLSVAEVAKCVSEASAGVAALGIVGCTPS